MKINGVHREDGQVMYFRLDNGNIVSKAQCIDLIKNGNIDNGVVSHSRRGAEFVKSRSRNQKLNDFDQF